MQRVVARTTRNSINIKLNTILVSFKIVGCRGVVNLESREGSHVIVGEDGKLVGKAVKVVEQVGDADSVAGHF